MHIADIHLGYRQYRLFERFRDFGRAFKRVIDVAIAEKVNFIICSGDLFDRDSIDPATFSQAFQILTKLKEASIPFITIEGNHDRKLSGKTLSWLQQLARMGLLILLRVKFINNELDISPYDNRKGRGLYYDINSDIRVFGTQYLGGTLDSYLKILKEKLTKNDFPLNKYNILLLHTGVSLYTKDRTGTIETGKLEDLKKYFHYIGVGHYHLRFEIPEASPWIFNPGSIETCGFDEVNKKRIGGYYIHTIQKDYSLKTEFHPARYRPFHRLKYVPKTSKTTEQMQQEIEDFIIKKAPNIRSSNPKDDSKAPVVELTLEGMIEFDPFDLDYKKIEKLAYDKWGALYVKINNHLEREEYAIDIKAKEESREAIESKVFEDFVKENINYRSNYEKMVPLIKEFKQLVLKGEEPENIIEKIRTWRESLEA